MDYPKIFKLLLDALNSKGLEYIVGAEDGLPCVDIPVNDDQIRVDFFYDLTMNGIRERIGWDNVFQGKYTTIYTAEIDGFVDGIIELLPSIDTKPVKKEYTK